MKGQILEMIKMSEQVKKESRGNNPYHNLSPNKNYSNTMLKFLKNTLNIQKYEFV